METGPVSLPPVLDLPELLLGDIEVLPDAAYDAILGLEQAAIDKGYPELK